MDLVSEYISDEEMETQEIGAKAVKKDNGNRNANKDPDALDVVFEKTAAKSQKPTDNDIECICLDDSDSDNREVSFSSELSKNNTTFSTKPSEKNISFSSEPSKSNTAFSFGTSKNDTAFPTDKKEISKQIDYMNLESSDSDDEQERIQNNVNNLLRSAAILNDIECGPTKPMPELHLSLPLLSCADNPPLVGKKLSLPSVSIINDVDDKNNSTSSAFDISGDKICSEKDLSSKKIKSDLFTTNHTNVNENAVEELDPRIGMYRKDDWIVAAYKKKDASHIPSTLSKTIIAHTKAISSLRWCPLPYSHLFLSSSLDCSIKIWDIYYQNKPIQTVNIPLGVRAAKWSKSGEQIIAGGFGKQAHLIDVLSGKTHLIYTVRNYVSCIAIHPFIEDVILCGTKNAILAFDFRVDSELPVRTFMSRCGEILDIAFLNKNEFVCSTSVVGRDSANRTIMVCDFNSGAIMSNQIFLERYTCPSLKINPFDSSFIAQTNGDYIASFSSRKPFKIKNKRYTGHKVSGFGIECDISPDGQYVASGDAKGDVYFYNYSDATVVNKLTIKPDIATNRLQWHPVLSSTLAVATWDGQIHVWK